MNRLREIRPLIFLTCLMTAIAIFFIYSSNGAKNNVKTLSEGQVSKSIIDAKAEEQREQRMADLEDTYTASRGGSDRLTKPKPADPAAFAAPVKPAAKPEPQYAGEVDVLARLIMAEAQGEPYEAKVAVGAVVINRVQSGQWAGTVKEVIYQKSGGYYQFTPVQNGWIDKPADAECIKAAKAALGGADPANGAQFYYDNTVTNEWILEKPVSAQIGHMTYAY